MPTGQHLVGEFVGHLKQLLISTRVTPIGKEEIVRTIAYTSTDDEGFMELVIKSLKGKKEGRKAWHRKRKFSMYSRHAVGVFVNQSMQKYLPNYC